MKFLLKAGLLRWLSAGMLICCLLSSSIARGEQIPVRYVEGTEHGFLVLRSERGRQLAVGDLMQVVHGDRVTARLIFKFRDGSVDDETTVFSQRGHFRLLTNHHLQKGPAFPHPMDIFIDAPSGRVTVRSTGKGGKLQTDVDHLDLPPDLVNGLILTLAKNIVSKKTDTTVPMVIAAPKPRIVHLAFSPQDKETLSIAGSSRKATRFAVKIELGGLAGVVAALIGKEPKESQMWILGGEAPAFVKAEYQFYEGGPIWSIQLTSPVWPRTPHPG